MKISKYQKSRLPTYVIVAVVFLIIGALVGFYIPNKPDESINPEKSSQTSTQEDQNAAKGPTNSQSGGTTDSIPVNNSLSANITTLEQSGENIKLEATVANSPKSGTCIVTFENPNDKPAVRSFESTEKGGAQICDALIPTLEFSYIGTWNVTFRFITEGTQVTANGKIDIR